MDLLFRFVRKIKDMEEQEEQKDSKKNISGGCILLIIVMAVIGYFIDNKKENDKPKTPQEIREEKIKSQFSSWYGYHWKLKELVQLAMHDPDSFEHVKTTYVDKGNYLVVKMIYRGKNVFGGKVVNHVTATVDLDGNVLEILDEGPGY